MPLVRNPLQVVSLVQRASAFVGYCRTSRSDIPRVKNGDPKVKLCAGMGLLAGYVRCKGHVWSPSSSRISPRGETVTHGKVAGG